MGRLYIEGTEVRDIYNGADVALPIESAYQGSTLIYGRKVIETASTAVHGVDSQQLDSNPYSNQGDRGILAITSDSSGITYEVTSGGNYSKGGLGNELILPEGIFGDPQYVYCREPVYTAIIEMGAYQNMSSVYLYYMAPNIFPTNPLQYAELTANTVNTVVITAAQSDYGCWFISGTRASDATWGWTFKNAYIQAGDWT